MNIAYQIISTYLTESSNGPISFDEYIRETGQNKQTCLDFLNKHVLKYLSDIYSKRYQEKYGTLTNAVVVIHSNSSAYYSLGVILENKTYAIVTYLVYVSETKELNWKKYYILLKTTNGKEYHKIAEGNEEKEFTSADKYGDLLKIKDVLKHQNTPKSLKLKV